MTTEYYSTRRNPSGLYRKAYRWAWSNLKSPKFSPAEAKTFNLSSFWAGISTVIGFFCGVAAAYLVIAPIRSIHQSFIFFVLFAFICLLVWPATQAAVIWLACMVKSLKKRKSPTA